MRIGFAYARRSRWPKYAWAAEAFERIGCAVRAEHTIAGMLDLEDWADAVVVEPKWLQNDPVPKRGPSLRIGWCFDLVATEPGRPLAEQPMMRDDGPLLRALRTCDLALVKERGMLGEYRRLGVDARWMDQGCPSWIGECEHRADPRWQVLALGGTRWAQRKRDAAAVAKAGHRVAWAVPEGGGELPPGVEPLLFCPPRELPSLVSQAAVVLDCGLRSDVDGYWSDKFWLLCGMGACQLRRWSPGLPPPGRWPRRYCTYRDETLLQALDRLLADRSVRAAMGRKAREWALRRHTYEHRAREVVQCVQETSLAGSAAARA